VQIETMRNNYEKEKRGKRRQRRRTRAAPRRRRRRLVPGTLVDEEGRGFVVNL
jgi:hypothetical protein